MSERPIMFSGPMVRALLAGKKTQTRRLVKPRPQDNVNDPLGPLWSHPTPYGSPGDLLWVRETHAQFSVGNKSGDAPLCVAYRATCGPDGEFDYVNNGDEIMSLTVTKWTPSIFMPRFASRLSLHVTDVRVERLQAISEDDAEAEGVTALDLRTEDQPQRDLNLHRSAFNALWDEINGKRAPWSSNPWVWAVSFEVAK